MKFEIREIKIVNHTFKNYGCEYIKLSNKYSFDKFTTSRCIETLYQIIKKYKKNPSVTFTKSMKRMCDNYDDLIIHCIDIEPNLGMEYLLGYHVSEDNIYENCKDYGVDLDNIDRSNPFFIISVYRQDRNDTMFQITCLLE